MDNIYLNRSNGGKQHLYREYFDSLNNRTLYYAVCGCPGTSNGHTQARGSLIPASSENVENLCKKGRAVLVRAGVVAA